LDPVEEIKSRLPIDELVGQYVELKRSGSSLRGLCPFHQEKTPSFYVHPDRGYFHCFGCGRGGDQFKFIMELEHLEFRDALQRLAERTGVELESKEARKPSLKGALQEANAVANRFFQQQLSSNEGRVAREYLERRKFDAAAIETFELGYAPRGRDPMVQHLQGEGFDERILLAAGLAIQDDIGGALRDRFHGRLMFSIKDSSSKVLGFGGRILGEGQPKYLNSPQTELFDKSSVLYGIHRSAEPIRKGRRAVLVEGYLDAIRAHMAGFTDTVASLGTAVTVQQLTTLSRMAEVVILALDPDPAGQNAAARTAISTLMEVTKARGRATGEAGAVDLRIARLPDGKGDPDELIRDAPELWEKTLASAKPAFEFFFDMTMESIDRSQGGWKQEAIDRLLPVIQQFSSSPGWQADWLQRLAAETGVDAISIQRSLPMPQNGRRQSARRPSRPEIVAQTTSRALTADPVLEIERGLLALLLQLLVVPREAGEALQGVQLEGENHVEILRELLQWQNFEYEMFRERLSPEAAETADILRTRALPLPPDGKLSVAVQLHLTRLREVRLRTHLQRAQQTLEAMSSTDQVEAAGSILQLAAQKSEIERELRRLEDLVHKG
jgi:DNA primase